MSVEDVTLKEMHLIRVCLVLKRMCLTEHLFTPNPMISVRLSVGYNLEE